jgi:hypothetical protein
MPFVTAGSERDLLQWELADFRSLDLSRRSEPAEAFALRISLGQEAVR